MSSISAPVRSTGSSKSIGANGFIIGPVADCLFIIGAPLLALIIAVPLFSQSSQSFVVSLRGRPYDLRQVFIIIFINAHLFLVYFRSHANPAIFRTYPLRFVVIPLGLFLLGAFSPMALGVFGLVAVWWDVYHSSLQTFGFGRIYDSKQRNDPAVGRRLDYWMNLLVYLGPVLAGAHFVNHLNSSTESLQFLTTEGNPARELLLNRTPDFLLKHQLYMAVAILAVGVPFVAYYICSYYRYEKAGYKVSWQKVWLLVITSGVSIYCWGFRSFFDAFWVMNFFHALQYFAIVTFVERENLSRLFRSNGLYGGGVIAIFWVVTFCLLYGLWSSMFVGDGWSASLVVTTSLMHFWYDGFIWSVKKKQV